MIEDDVSRAACEAVGGHGGDDVFVLKTKCHELLVKQWVVTAAAMSAVEDDTSQASHQALAGGDVYGLMTICHKLLIKQWVMTTVVTSVCCLGMIRHALLISLRVVSVVLISIIIICGKNARSEDDDMDKDLHVYVGP